LLKTSGDVSAAVDAAALARSISDKYVVVRANTEQLSALIAVLRAMKRSTRENSAKQVMPYGQALTRPDPPSPP
jgi:hypothetical protein